jgi:hypothetical protein
VYNTRTHSFDFTQFIKSKARARRKVKIMDISTKRSANFLKPLNTHNLPQSLGTRQVGSWGNWELGLRTRQQYKYQELVLEYLYLYLYRPRKKWRSKKVLQNETHQSIPYYERYVITITFTDSPGTNSLLLWSVLTEIGWRNWRIQNKKTKFLIVTLYTLSLINCQWK